MGFKENMNNIWEKISIPFIFLLLLLTAILGGIAYYIYQNYVAPKGDYVANREFIKEDDTTNKSALLFIIYADWCPHSQKVIKNSDKEDEGGWYKLKKNWENQESDLRLINNYSIQLTEINESDKKAMSDFEESYKKCEIKEFPSIFLIKDEECIEFDAVPSETNLIKFLNSVI